MHTVSFESPFNIRSDSRSPPPPSVEDDLDGIAFTPANLPLDFSSPTTLEHRVLENNAPKVNVRPTITHSTFRLITLFPILILLSSPMTTTMLKWRVVLIGLWRHNGRIMVSTLKQVDRGLSWSHNLLPAGCQSGFRLDFSHLDLVPDSSPNPNYVPTTRDRSSDLDVASSRWNPPQHYV